MSRVVDLDAARRFLRGEISREEYIDSLDSLGASISAVSILKREIKECMVALITWVFGEKKENRTARFQRGAP